MPNFKALMLNVSRNSYEKAQEALDERLEIRSDEERLSCDYMENMAVAVVTAVCAVESFANEHLDDEEKGKRLTDEKLKVLLPDKLGVHRPSQRAWWPDFVGLVKIRNEFVHEKGTVLHDDRTKLVWNKLGKMRNSPNELSCEVIRHFLRALHLPGTKLGQKTGTAPSWSRTLGSAPEGRGRLTTGGSSPFRSVARGCGESFIGGTPGVTPFRRLLRRTSLPSDAPPPMRKEPTRDDKQPGRRPINESNGYSRRSTSRRRH